MDEIEEKPYFPQNISSWRLEPSPQNTLTSLCFLFDGHRRRSSKSATEKDVI